MNKTFHFVRHETLMFLSFCMYFSCKFQLCTSLITSLLTFLFMSFNVFPSLPYVISTKMSLFSNSCFIFTSYLLCFSLLKPEIRHNFSYGMWSCMLKTKQYELRVVLGGWKKCAVIVSWLKSYDCHFMIEYFNFQFDGLIWVIWKKDYLTFILCFMDDLVDFLQ